MTKNGAGRARRVSRAVVAAVIGLTMVVGNATPSFAAQVWYVLENGKGTPQAQPLYLTIGGGLKGQATLHDSLNSATQEWTFQVVSDYFFIRSGASTQQWALSVLGNSSANKTPVVQYTYQPTNEYQQWREERFDDGFRYRNVATKKCLAANGGTADRLPNGTGVIIYDCGTGLDQLWHEHQLP